MDNENIDNGFDQTLKYDVQIIVKDSNEREILTLSKNDIYQNTLIMLSENVERIARKSETNLEGD